MQRDADWIEIVDSDGVVTHWRYKVEYKWWTSRMTHMLKVNHGSYDLNRFPWSTGNARMREVMQPVVRWLPPVTKASCESIPGAKFWGTVRLDYPLAKDEVVATGGGGGGGGGQ